jgi:hypothetical protein
MIALPICSGNQISSKPTPVPKKAGPPDLIGNVDERRDCHIRSHNQKTRGPRNDLVSFHLHILPAA